MTSNTNNSNTDTTDLDVIDSDITKHRLRAILLIILVGVLYLYLGDKKLPESAQSWGTFGDFIGGILNPIFALFAFYWLTYSVRLQVKELKDTRQELQKAADAQMETSKHQEKIAKLEEININTQIKILDLQQENLNRQNISLTVQKDTAEQQQEQIAIQNFESLFFQLLTTKKNSLNDIFTYDHKDKHYGSNAIRISVKKFKTTEIDENWTNFYTQNLLFSWGSYFRICYQIVKLIDENINLKPKEKRDNFKNFDYSYTQKKYFDIFRATFTQYELEALFFNCLSEYGAPKFKNLLSKYGIFEPLLIDNNRHGETFHRLTRYGYLYEKFAFEENNTWKNYFYEVNSIPLNYTQEDIFNRIEDLLELLFVERTAISHSLGESIFINQPFCFQINHDLSITTINDFFSIENIKNIKRNTNSGYIKNLKLIKLSRESIENAQKSIEDIQRLSGSNIDHDKEFIPNPHTTYYTTINKLLSTINLEKESIRGYKDEIKELNKKLNTIVNSKLSKHVLYLIKYGISYDELIKLKTTN